MARHLPERHEVHDSRRQVVGSAVAVIRRNHILGERSPEVPLRREVDRRIAQGNALEIDDADKATLLGVEHDVLVPQVAMHEDGRMGNRRW